MRYLSALRQKTISGYGQFNDFIYRVQQIIGRFYEQYFTLYAALFFAFCAGAFLGFTGDNCYGKVPFDSPLFWIALVIAGFFFFQTFIIVRLTGGRILRLATVAICGHYLSYQAYGFWSLENVDRLVANLSSVSAANINSVVFESGFVNTVNGVGVCKPFVFANIIYGHIWVTAPAVVLIMICFFIGEGKQIEEETGE